MALASLPDHGEKVQPPSLRIISRNGSHFAGQQRCDIVSPPVPMAVDFLSMLYERGSSAP